MFNRNITLENFYLFFALEVRRSDQGICMVRTEVLAPIFMFSCNIAYLCDNLTITELLTIMSLKTILTLRTRSSGVANYFENIKDCSTLW